MRSLEYWAGYFDGEGTVRINRALDPSTKAVKSYALLVQLTNTYRPSLLELKAQFGGKVIMSSHPQRKPQHRQSYVWYCYGNTAAAFLLALSPFLVEKKQQAVLALSFPRKNTGAGGKSSEEKALQAQIYEELYRLKHLES